MNNTIKWAALVGKWDFGADKISYKGPTDPASAHGIALSSLNLRGGQIKAKVNFIEPQSSSGRIVFGYNPLNRAYFSAGIGGYSFAYILDEYKEGRGWKGIRGQGSTDNLKSDNPFELEVHIRGQRTWLKVDSLKVLEENLPSPLSGGQIGLFAWGDKEVNFENFEVSETKPRAFVVMQFGEPYNSLYTDVIKNVAENLGFEAYRADDVYKPGIILQDIITGITEAEVVIAEITSMNANVFYELGYAHATGKQTILLAERGHELPFDIRSYRCIFYDNTIKGKSGVEANLYKHLESILKGN